MYSLAAKTTARAAARSLAPMAATRATPIAAAQKRHYHENIVDHYENPRNVGALDKNDKTVGTVRSWGTKG